MTSYNSTYNPVANALLVYDNASKKILEYNIDDETLNIIDNLETDTMVDMDIDIVTQNVYILNSAKEVIEVLSLNSRSRMIWKNEFRCPTALVAVPELGCLYASQWISNIGYVWKLNLNGSKDELVATSDMLHPVKLQYIYNQRGIIRLIWNNRISNALEYDAFSTDSLRRRLPDEAIADFVAFDKVFYWSENTKQEVFHVTELGLEPVRQIYVADQNLTSSIKLAVMGTNLTRVKDLLAEHECSKINQKKKNCSHICIPDRDIYSARCACPIGMVLNSDNLTCLDCSRKRNALVCNISDFIFQTKLNLKQIEADVREMLIQEDSFGNINDADVPQSHTKYILGLVVALICMIFGVIIFMLTKRLRLKNQILSEMEIQEFLRGKKAEDHTQANDGHIFSLTYNANKFEIQKHEFVKANSTVIGGGNFGVVYKSYMSRFNGEVAVKSPKSANPDEIRSVLCEIKILSFVGDHSNIVKLLGAYTKELNIGTVLIITELCQNGSLLNYLKRITNQMPKEELLITLFRFCEEIALGMEYLAQKVVVHGDLSARNVLLDVNYKCKICDFGLSRKLERYATYVKQTDEPLPWPWLSLESLDRHEFTLKSDIWSMGVTYWEIFTLGARPYAGQGCNQAFIDRLKNGYRLPKPELVSPDEFAIILQCWELEPATRPDASSFRQFFACEEK